MATKGGQALRAKDCSALVYLPLCFCPRMSKLSDSLLEMVEVSPKREAGV